MKYIQLTQGYQTMVDDDLYEWLNQWKWFYHKRGGNRKGGDAVRSLHGYDANGKRKLRTLYMSNIIHPVPDGFVVDHEDRNPMNNQRHNLRKATYRLNVRNSDVRVTNKIGEKYIHWAKDRETYVVQIPTPDKRLWKQFKDIEDAKTWRDWAVKKYKVL